MQKHGNPGGITRATFAFRPAPAAARALFVAFALLPVSFCSRPSPGGHASGDARPVVIVTHPTVAFLESLTALQERKQLPSLRLLLLAHRRERRLQRAVERARRRLQMGDAIEWVILQGLPRIAQGPVNSEETRRLGFRSRRLEPRAPYDVPPQWEDVFRDAASRSDGVLVPGGSNIPAALYGEQQLVEATSTTPLRSLYELALLRYLLVGDRAFLKGRRDYLVMGLCYGMQALNVALGGSLVQSIPQEIYGVRYAEDLVGGDPDRMHRNYHLALRPASKKKVYRGWFHRLRITQSTSFFIKSQEVYILSNHVQAVKRPAADLAIVGWSADGRVPELAAHRKYRNVLALQGHPERDFAWRRLDRQPPATLAFHKTLWAETRRVLEGNARRRIKRARASAGQPGPGKESAGE